MNAAELGGRNIPANQNTAIMLPMNASVLIASVSSIHTVTRTESTAVMTVMFRIAFGLILMPKLMRRKLQSGRELQKALLPRCSLSVSLNVIIVDFLSR
jgi:hypothetical protein